MPRRPLKDLGAPAYSGGARSGPNGVSLPKVSNLLGVWGSGANNPLAGIGRSSELSWMFSCVHKIGADNVLIVVGNEPVGAGVGIYEYTLDVTADPITATPRGFSPWAGLGLGTIPTIFCCDYDPDEATLLINSYTPTTAIAATMGRWSVTAARPFAAGNAIWTGVPSAYGAYVAGKVGYYAQTAAINKALDQLILASFYGGNAEIFKYSDGTHLGGKLWNATFNAAYKPTIIGINPAGEVMLGGCSPWSGEVNRYDTTNPAAWVDNGKVYDKQSSAWNLGILPTYKRPLPQWGYSTYGMVKSILRGQHDCMGLTADEWAIMVARVTYLGMSSLHSMPQVTTHNMTTDVWRDIRIDKATSYNRSGVGVTADLDPSFVRIEGQPWMIYGTQATIDHLAEQPLGSRYANGVAAMHVGIGHVQFAPFSVTYPEQPTAISVGAGSRDSEFSTHPGKFRLRMSVDAGVSWTGWRPGNGLADLTAAYDGDPAWPMLLPGQTIILEMEMSSGVLHSFQESSGNPDYDTDPLPISDIGPPFDLVPTLHTDYLEYGGGFL